MKQPPLPERRRLPLLLRCAWALLAPSALPARAITNDPPNYFLAGSISGTCLYCHPNGPD